MLSFTIGRSAITVFIDGVFNTIDNTQPNYPLLLEELRRPPAEREMDAIRAYATVKAMIERLTVGAVTITDTEVLFEGSAIGNYLAERMLEIINDGIDIEPYAYFMNNVMANPATYVHDELYQWMEKGRLPITPDGHFLAFKKVRANYTDVHTGQFDNSPGCLIEMDRAGCDTNRHNHCSSGFHFASTGYLSQFGGERVVVVKINPRDVTSIPSDYKFTKGRCCRYEVIAELMSQSAAYDECWKKGVVACEDPSEFPANIISRYKASGVLPEATTAVSDPADADDLINAHFEKIESEMIDALSVRREGDRLVVTPPADADALTSFDKAQAANEAVVGIRTSTVRDTLEPVTEEITFKTADEREITLSEIKSALVDASIRAAARKLSIGDSTLRGWMKRAGILPSGGSVLRA